LPEKMCDWCGVSKASTGLRRGEQYCSTCDPYAWAAFLHPETYEENKRIALTRVERRLVEAEYKASPKGFAGSDEVTSKWVNRKELVAARIAFVGMFLAVLVAVVGIFVVGGKC